MFESPGDVRELGEMDGELLWLRSIQKAYD